MNWIEWLFSFWRILILAILAIVALSVVCERRYLVRRDGLPVTTAPARIVAKRAQTSGFLGVSTWNYATFELASGQRLEFIIPPEGYGLLVEGDEGELTYQVMDRGVLCSRGSAGSARRGTLPRERGHRRS
jgi:hypothetical protein